MPKMRSLILCVVILAVSAAVWGAVRAQSAAPSLGEADKLYAQRSYAKALEGYQEALKTGKLGNRRAEVEYRVCVCLGRSQKWDEALEQTENFIKANAKGLWAARGHYWLGQLYSVVPHAGYRVGGKVYRGENYPKIEGAEKPEQVYLSDEDAKNALLNFEKAKGFYEQLQPRNEKEEADLNFDLASVLTGSDLTPMVKALIALEKEKNPGLVLRFGEADPKEVAKLREHNWEPTPKQRYDAQQPLPQRLTSLPEQILSMLSLVTSMVTTNRI